MEKTLEVSLETDVVTCEIVAEFVTSIFEFLLYQRAQIPFVCQTFKYFVSKWNNKDDESADDAPANFEVERQKGLGRKTLDCIKQMGEVIRSGFQKSNISRVRFLFGATAATAREAYTIVIPSISRSHSCEHHKLKLLVLNKALIYLLTSDDLDPVLSTTLPPTNVYLEMEMPDDDAIEWEQVFSTDVSEFPANCKKIEIKLLHVLPEDYTEKNCCKELTVFEDIAKLTLASESPETETVDKEIEKTINVGWWEASTIVKGLPYAEVNGKNFWQEE